MNCKIYEITHKPCFYIVPKEYVPIQVGRCNTGITLPYCNDETGDSIATKNANYCELTAWYWLWKNAELPDYVGLCHYRRFFVKKTNLVFRGGTDVLTEEAVVRIMEKYDIILPRKIECGMTVKEFYYKHGEGKKKDIEKVEEIIMNHYPEYVDAMNNVFSSTSSSYWNLAVMKKGDFIAYCQWLFDILFALEQTIDISAYSPAEARIYGYLSEILINVWVNKNKLKVYNTSIIFVDNNPIKNRLRRLRAYKEECMHKQIL